MTAITTDIQQRVTAIIGEMNRDIEDRAEVIHGIWVARIAQEHLLMIGPGGTGKSFIARRTSDHIDGSIYFETAFDETTDPSQVFGSPDIKEMVNTGKTRRVADGMFPEATDAFLDEFFNGNGPLLHSLMPALNERAWHNNGQPTAIPLRQCLMGTNKLNADADQAALWDRVHLRYEVAPVSTRAQRAALVGKSIARMATVGRGTTTNVSSAKTTVTIAELDQAHKEALALDVPDTVINTFFDIREELEESAKIMISDRRSVEGMAAVMANAWLRGHESVTVADLDILSAMWWTLLDHAPAARGVILSATNPGEKAAMDLLDDLDKIQKELKDSPSDDVHRRRAGVEAVKNADRIEQDAQVLLTQAQAAGTGTTRIDEVLHKADAFKKYVAKDIFGLGSVVGN